LDWNLSVKVQRFRVQRSKSLRLGTLGYNPTRRVQRFEAKRGGGSEKRLL
jgi:hypothetical protein